MIGLRFNQRTVEELEKKLGAGYMKAAPDWYMEGTFTVTREDDYGVWCKHDSGREAYIAKWALEENYIGEKDAIRSRSKG